MKKNSCKLVLLTGLIWSSPFLWGQESAVFNFKNVGPTRGGRVTTVRGVTSQTNVYYMGASGGGVWKTTDYGQSWKNISDGYFATGSIGAIAVDQKHPDTLYVGTGSEAIRSNVITGKGIYKSMDGGETWKFVGLRNAGQIGAIEIDPSDSKIVYAAVMGQAFGRSEERGLYKSMDGGKKWHKALYLSDSVGCVDVELAPGNPKIIYAAMWRAERKPWTIISGDTTGGVFRSTDGGDTWQKIKNGLPRGLIGKIDFAVSKAKPERVWAIIQAPDGEEGVYKSDDFGESWQRIRLPDKVAKSWMYRPYYFHNLDVNPQNPDNIYSGTKQSYTSRDGGKTWKKITFPHADHHDLWINPKDSLLMIEGSDGGAAVSRDGGKSWSTLFNQPTAELYQVEVDDRYPFWLYAGQQDNSTIMVPIRKPYESVADHNHEPLINDLVYWKVVGGCETGPVVPKPGDPNVVYTNCKGRFGVYDHRTGQEKQYYIGAESLYGHNPKDLTYRFQRVTPLHVSPHDANVVYYGSQFLHKTTDAGKNWEQISPDLTAFKSDFQVRSGGPISEDISGEEYYSTLYAIRESPVSPGVIWTGANDGPFYLSKDGGKSWKEVTPPDLPEGGRVQNIEASPHKAGKAYYAVYRYLLDDWQPYLYKTEDFGTTWERLTDNKNGIPSNYPVRVVREDPNKEGLLYAGTEFGLFISFDDGKKWYTFQQNLPVTPITDIKIKRNQLALSTMGRSFWHLNDISVLSQLSQDETDQTQLFTPKNSFGENINVFFSLSKEDKKKPIRAIFKRDNIVLHQKRLGIDTAQKKEKDGNPVKRLFKTVWDLRYYFPNGKRDARGPKVAPGLYEVILQVGDRVYRKSFEYKINPNLTESGITADDLMEQEMLNVKLAKMRLEVKNVIKELETKIKKSKKSKKISSWQQTLDQLQKGKKRYDQPRLYDHIDYLYEMLTTAPQPPGKDAYERYEYLKTEWENIREKVD